MDGFQFDAWTRRQVGLAIGGGLASALGVRQLNTVTAKKKKKRCRKFNQNCQADGRKCCQGLTCDESVSNPTPHCCLRVRGVCEAAEDCCGDFVCDQISGLGEQTRCCKANGGSCTKDTDCCDTFACDETIGECVP